MIDLTQLPRPEASGTPHPAPARPTPARILLIEDEADLCDAIARILRDAGHRVLTVEDGLEAFSYLDQGTPDLIVSDIDMPNLDGLELLRRIRATPALASTPVIFLTALDGSRLLRNVMNLGADDFLQKPVDRAELLHSVESRLRRSRDYRNQCEARLRRQKDFVSLIAHDLRAPLTAFQLGLGLAALRAGQADRDPAGEPLDHQAMENAVASMTRLVDRLLLTARRQGESIPFEPRQVNLHDLCGRAAELSCGYRSPRHALDIRVPAGEAARAWLDPVLVEQILCNLLSNAFKYSPEGGQVILSAQPDGLGIRFEVADQGSGMAPEEVARLFVSPFRSPRHEQIAGHGLGLLGVKLLVESHGGRIECRSELGNGTRFTVTFPSESIFRAYQG